MKAAKGVRVEAALEKGKADSAEEHRGRSYLLLSKAYHSLTLAFESLEREMREVKH